MPRVQVETVQGPTRRKSKYKAMTITLRQGKDVVGGLTGSTWMNWLYVELLWIADKYRGKGHGRSLMKKAEDEARKRGVKNVFLNSFSFQAPGFYKKLGYKEFGKLKDFPAGHTRHWLMKAL